MIIGTVDRNYLDLLRGASILRVMLAHLGLSWFFIPYSQYIGIFLPVFFFVSGAVAFNSIKNNSSKPYYFTNRYISLITPFLLFSLPFLFIVLSQTKSINIYEIIKWLIAWPPRSTYIFDMRQLWFINALILMFLITYPIFKLSIKSNLILTLTLIMSILYVPLSEHLNSIHYLKQIEVLKSLDLPMQIHQVFSFMNYYLFGAIYYQLNTTNSKYLKICLAVSLVAAVLLHIQIPSFNNMKAFFFNRGLYFTTLSYTVIFFLLIHRDKLSNIFNKLILVKKFLLHLSKHSYSLFLIHTPIIFIFEQYIGLNNLGKQPLLALIKMLGVIFASVLLAPLMTNLYKKVLMLIMIKNTNHHLKAS